MINALLKRRMENKKKNKKGFTLVELIVVLVIIAILAAVLVPTVSGYIGRAKKTAAQSALKNVVTASSSAGTDLLASGKSVKNALNITTGEIASDFKQSNNQFVSNAVSVGGNKVFDGVYAVYLDDATGTVTYATYTDGTYYATYNGTTNTYTTGKIGSGTGATTTTTLQSGGTGVQVYKSDTGVTPAS
jgi:type IV pilus assembly protein PilA